MGILHCMKIQKQPSRGVLRKRCSENTTLQENTHAEVRFQQSCKTTLLTSHFGMGVIL